MLLSSEQGFIATGYFLIKPLLIWARRRFPWRSRMPAWPGKTSRPLTAARCSPVYPGGMPSAIKWDIRAWALPLWKMRPPVDHPHSGRRTCPSPPERTISCLPSASINSARSSWRRRPCPAQPQPKPENVAPPEPKQSQPEPEKDERVDSKFKKMLPVQYFADLAQHYMKEYGVTRQQLGQVSVKSHFNASLNPYAHFQKPCTLEQANNARMVVDPLTVLHCCPMDDGAAAVIVCAKETAKKYTDKLCPTVAASVNKSTPPDGDFFVTLTRLASREAYKKAGIGPEDLDLIELHDAFTIEEIIYLEALGLCETGQGGKLVEDGVTAITGKHPINTSGGLISMGHPVGPTGIGQVAEILWQMRASVRQTADPKACQLCPGPDGRRGRCLCCSRVQKVKIEVKLGTGSHFLYGTSSDCTI